MKFNDTFIDVMSQNLQLGLIPILLGKAGIGKTSVLRSAADQLGASSFTLAVNLLASKEDLTGVRMTENADGEPRQSFFPHEDVMEAIEHAEAHPDEPVLIILDEINRTPADVTSGILGFSTDRKLGRRRLPKNLLIAATGNDKGNVAALDEASLSRFVVYYVEADAQVFMNYMGDRLNRWVRQVLEADNDLINGDSTPMSIAKGEDDQDPDDEFEVSYGSPFDGEETSQITTPRTLEYLSMWLNDCSDDQLASFIATPAKIKDREANYLSEIVEGFVGNTQFTDRLVAAIAEDLGHTAAQAVSVTRPGDYDQLIAVRTTTQMVNTIGAMSDQARVDALLFAMHDSRDNSQLVKMLAENIDALSADHHSALLTMANNQELDDENVRALIDSGTDLGEELTPTLSTFI